MDIDGDGVFSLEDLRALVDRGPAEGVNTDSAVGALLARHHNSSDAAAANLARSRREDCVDVARVTECLVVAGVTQVLAVRAAAAIAHLCAAPPSMPEVALGAAAALRRACATFGVIRSAGHVDDLRDHLAKRYTQSSEAFRGLLRAKAGAVSLEDFEARVRGFLRWPRATEHGVLEEVFRVLDLEGVGAITVDGFSALDTFDATRVISAATSVGRRLSALPRLPRSLRGLELADNALGAGVTRQQLAEAWAEVSDDCSEADGKLVFGLLDREGTNCLLREDLAILTGNLPRRAEAGAAGDLVATLLSKHGDLASVHRALLQLATEEPA